MTIIKETMFENLSGLRVLSASSMGQSFFRHSHDCCILGLVLAGKRRIEFIAESIDLSEGDIFQIAPRKMHKCSFNSEQKSDYFIVAIPIRFFEDHAEDLFDHNGLFNLEARIEDKRLLKLFQQAVKLFQDRSVVGEFEGTLIDLVMYWLGLIRETLEYITDIPKNFQEVIGYIDEHYQEKLVLEDIAAAAFLSPYHFQRKFLKYYGCSPFQYIEKKRLGRVNQLLSSGVKASIAALDGGFADQSHFCRVFKKRQGVTARNYIFDQK